MSWAGPLTVTRGVVLGLLLAGLVGACSVEKPPAVQAPDDDAAAADPDAGNAELTAADAGKLDAKPEVGAPETVADVADAMADAAPDAAEPAPELPADVGAELPDAAAEVDVVVPEVLGDVADAATAEPDAAEAVEDALVAEPSLPDLPPSDLVVEPGPEVVAEVLVDAGKTDLPDAAPPPLDATITADGFPSWKDKNGCENYQYFDNGVCKNQNPPQEKQETTLCWKTGKVNDFGVGKPCLPGLKMCSGQMANCCVTDAKKYGALCTMPCDKAGGCGPNAYCHQNLCFPSACTELFDVFYVKNKKKDKGFPCSAKANDKGVGTTCTAGGAECAAIAGSYCLGDSPYYLPADQPDLTSFCTIGCESSADCGAGGQCIFSNGKPYFCAPAVCAAQFDGILFMNEPGSKGPPTPGEQCVPE